MPLSSAGGARRPREACASTFPSAPAKCFWSRRKTSGSCTATRSTRALGNLRTRSCSFPAASRANAWRKWRRWPSRWSRKGGDRSSLVVAFGGGILTDVAGFLAAIFMRGIPVIQIPTTLLAQVDAAIGGKTGVNLVRGKNLIGSFHQPLAVLIDPARARYAARARISRGPVRDHQARRHRRRRSVLADAPRAAARDVARARRGGPHDLRFGAHQGRSGFRRREGTDRRRILNFGHTFGHALEAETGYSRFLHGEAVAWGMKAAALLGAMERLLSAEDKQEILRCVNSYGPLPPLDGHRSARAGRAA